MALEHTPLLSSEGLETSRGLSQHGRPPAEVPDHQLIRRLDEGAFGEVWLARDNNSGGQVAVKFYKSHSADVAAQLHREVQKLLLLADLRHVIRIFRVGWNQTPPYYTMEFCPAGSLEKKLELEGPMTAAQAVPVFREVAIALMHAHGLGILHCDLKPANILLDGEGRPRLADFGQARLCHEQSRALGTLFYMAPEQAAPNAVPDARWDVYALGAVLYRMLTGQPPHRTSAGTTALQQASNMGEKLGHYRELLQQAARHRIARDVPGIDSRLARILEGCLAIDPARRFPNVQAVLEALNARALARTRRPLLVLGALGPILFLFIVAVIGTIAFQRAIDASRRQATQQARESDEFAARFAAETVARQINHRWLVLHREADDPELHRLLLQAQEPAFLEQLRQTRVEEEALALEPYRQLFDWITRRQEAHQEQTPADNWTLLDLAGNQLVRSPQHSTGVGKNFAYRDYFHGQHGRNEELPPKGDALLSTVYKSRPHNRWTVTFSVPINVDGHLRGVLTMSVSPGNFVELVGKHPSQFAVLIDRRPDFDHQLSGLVLQHPRLLDYAAQHPSEELRMDVTTLSSATYNDPAYPDETDLWLGAAEPVHVKRLGDGRTFDTGWIVVVQEKYADVVRPVDSLKTELAAWGLAALGLIAFVVLGLWTLVIGVLSNSPRSRLGALLRRKAGLTPERGSTGSGPHPTPASRPTPRAEPLMQTGD